MMDAHRERHRAFSEPRSLENIGKIDCFGDGSILANWHVWSVP